MRSPKQMTRGCDQLFHFWKQLVSKLDTGKRSFLPLLPTVSGVEITHARAKILMREFFLHSRGLAVSALNGQNFFDWGPCVRP